MVIIYQCNHRSSGCNTFLSFYEQGQQVEGCGNRKLLCGDYLHALIDTLNGWCDLKVNDDEYSHHFEIPPGSAEDYVFAMTLANDHRVSIQLDSHCTQNDSYGFNFLPSLMEQEKMNQTTMKVLQLNQNHSEMLETLKRRMRRIAHGDKMVDMVSVQKMSLLWEVS